MNTNENPGQLDPQLLNRTGTRWIRSFVEVFLYKEQFDKGVVNPRRDFREWNAYKKAADGRNAILNLKWNFEKAGVPPPIPGSAEEEGLFTYLDRHILSELAPHADIIVTGNEPFVETSRDHWVRSTAYAGIPLVVFYQRLTKHVHDYLTKAGLRDRVALYVGAFTKLGNKTMQSQEAVRQLLRYAETMPYVDGIDMHTHVSSLREIDMALDFAERYTSKPIIVTEYTFVWAADRAIDSGERLNQPFARNWGLDPRMTVEEYMTCRVFRKGPGCRGQARVSKKQWDDFFQTRGWFIDHFLLEADKIFRAHNVNGSTFGLVQDEPTLAQLSKEGIPWYLGFLFSAAAVEPEEDGSPAPNYQYLDDFRRLQSRDGNL